MPKKKAKRTSKTSSGLGKMRNALRRARRLQMKINRWDRYVSEIESGRRRGNVARWNTEKMKKHIQFLQKVS